MARKRTARPEVLTCTYILQIDNWEWSYSFGVNDPRYDDQPYSDYRHMVVRAKVLLPSKLKLKAELAELTFMPDVSASDLDTKPDRHPVGVGSIDLRDAGIAGGFSMASDALDPVMQMMVAGRFKFIVLEGEKMRYRKPRIRHYRFETQLNLEEYPDD